MSKFFCDTNCELWYEKAEQLGINVIKMPYTLGNEMYFYDLGKETDCKAFFGAMRNGDSAKTQALNMDEYIEYFEPVFASGEDIVYVTFSQTMSGTFNSMRLAIEALSEKYPERKITVIDNNVGYGGGLNIADEYINAITRFGVWKDTAFRIEGEAVYGLTSTFIRAWHLAAGEALNYANYKPTVKKESDGIIQPYFDTPLDKLNICESAYLGVINNAKKYVYITTPYLVIDNEMITSLCLAAQSGIDVKIMVPGIPDKWYVYYITQSYYRVLLDAGVEIYEYTPGFLHAKMYVSDDIQAIVGSANMDFRSMYLHFENCCSFYGGSMVEAVKADFENTLSQCRKVTIEQVKKTPLWKRIFQIVFRIWSPMM